MNPLVNNLLKNHKMEESSWKILWRNPFTLYITVCSCVGLALLGYYTGTIIRLMCIQHDFKSLFKEVFLGPNVVWSVFGAAIGCWMNGYPAEMICVADLIIFTCGLAIYARIQQGYGSDDDDAPLFVAKLFAGVAIGMVSVASPRYMSRAPASMRIRGYLVRLHCFCFAVGGCVSLCYALFATTQEPERTADMISITLFPALLQLFLTTFVNPESPLWGLIKDESFVSGKVAFFRLQSSQAANMDRNQSRTVNGEP